MTLLFADLAVQLPPLTPAEAAMLDSFRPLPDSTDAEWLCVEFELTEREVPVARGLGRRGLLHIRHLSTVDDMAFAWATLTETGIAAARALPIQRGGERGEI